MGAFLFLTPIKASAHCDTMNGPVVTAGQKALDSGNVNYALVWIKKEDEQLLIQEFKKALKNRQTDAKNADIAFLESLVKIHREGEGATYTGLKAEADLEPSIAAADKALVTGNLQPVLEIVSEKYHTHIQEIFTHLQELSKYDVNDVKAGREYVEGYVVYVHTVEAAAQGKEFESHHEEPKAAQAVQVDNDSEVATTKSALVNGMTVLVGLLGVGVGLIIKKLV